jgi:CDP-diglyceride synthetase
MKTRLLIGPLLIALVAGLMWMDYRLLDTQWASLATHPATESAAETGPYVGEQRARTGGASLHLTWREAEITTFRSPIYHQPWGFIGLAVLGGLLCVAEAAKLLKKCGMAPDMFAIGAAGIGALAWVSLLPARVPVDLNNVAGFPLILVETAFVLIACFCFLLLLATARRIWQKDVAEFPKVFAGTMLAFIYVIVPVGLIIGIRKLIVFNDPHFGLWMVIWLVACCRLGADSCAYFVGKAIGRKKLIPHVSPGKTVEGFVGGVAGAMLLGWGCALLMPQLLSAFSMWGILAVSAGFGLVTPVGDLVESALKRAAGVKDSGRLLPEFGGALDLLDGFLLTGPLLFLVLLVA